MFETVAIIFVVFLLGLIFYGYSIVVRKVPTQEELQMERCFLCRQRFPKDNLVEREIGDFKLLYFCNACIASLVEDAKKQLLITKQGAGPLFLKEMVNS